MTTGGALPGPRAGVRQKPWLPDRRFESGRQGSLQQTEVERHPPTPGAGRLPAGHGACPAGVQVIATTPTGFSIAAPDDPSQLDVSGFDSDVPSLLADHSVNRL